jgi:hypothetical protein
MTIVMMNQQQEITLLQRPERPTSVTVLCVLNAIVGCVEILSGGLTFVWNLGFGESVLYGLFPLSLGLGMLILGIEAARARNWARVGLILCSLVFGIVYSFSSIIQPAINLTISGVWGTTVRSLNCGRIIVGLAWIGVHLSYLTRRDIKQFYVPLEIGAKYVN